MDTSKTPAASTSVLDAVLAIFREILREPGVGPDDDFFELGGDSAQALEVIAMLDETIGAQVGVVTLFTRPTAAELAQALEEETDVSS
jgi:acyl carrier protein